LDENENVVRNKTRLVVKGCNKEEGIDFDKTFTPVARLKAIRILLPLHLIRILDYVKWISIVPFEMDIYKKKFIWDNLLTFKIQILQITFINFKKSFMSKTSTRGLV